MSPTLYILDVTERRTGGYEIWESHCGQEKGCISTEPEFVDFVQTKEEVQGIIDDWKINPPIDGVLDMVNWEEQPRLPEKNIKEVTDKFCGRYSDYPEMIIAMCELSGLKAYRVVADDGSLRYFSFEVEK
jgi:hypothetical protein